MMKVVVVGGTHGNELTGVQILKYLENNSSLEKQFGLKIIPLLANPKALSLNRRFVDKDLNRSFLHCELNNKNDVSYEGLRAVELSLEIESIACDFLIDLHTTTSNMGKCIVMHKTDKLSLACISHLKSIFPELKIIEASKVDDESPFLGKLSKSSLIIEVGPIPNGVLSAQTYIETKNIVLEIFTFLKKYSQNPTIINDYTLSFERYKIFEHTYFPQDEKGNLMGLVHPNFEGQDFVKIPKGQLLFWKFNGDVVCHDDEEFYPVFINEAAYFPDKIAFMKCRRIKE